MTDDSYSFGSITSTLIDSPLYEGAVKVNMPAQAVSGFGHTEDGRFWITIDADALGLAADRAWQAMYGQSLLCRDCRRDVAEIKEFAYWVTDEVWAESDTSDGLLCIGCLETRLKRKLVASDFKPGAWPNAADADRSRRLRARMASVG